ncbi:MAG TPA: Trp biosynthesis-associated membrane protein [Streptosporangiaceae bacterium]
MAVRRELFAAALLCAVGAALVVLAAGRQWAVVEVVGAGTPLSASLTGRELAGPAAAFGWAGLAGLAALVAVRGRARVAVGAALVAFGFGAAYDSVAGVRRGHVLAVAEDRSNLTAVLSTEVHHNGWWVVCAAGGGLLVVAGLLAVLRGRRWPGLSARYQRPGRADAAADAGSGQGGTGAPVEVDSSMLWRSLDRGEDPTDDGDGAGASGSAAHGGGGRDG